MATHNSFSAMKRLGLTTAFLASALAHWNCLLAQPSPSLSDSEQVGVAEPGRIVTPVNQLITPYGRSIDLAGMRPQAVALSPDHKLLVTAGKTNELVVIDPAAVEIRQRVPLPRSSAAPQSPVSEQELDPDKDDQLSFNGLIFAPSGDRIFMSNVSGSIHVFDVSSEGKVSPNNSWPLPTASAPGRKAEIPCGLAISDDAKKLYVCGNLSNRLIELDTQTGKLLRTFDVGVAPYDVVLAGEKAYVSNWGGRRPGPGDVTGPAGRGTLVRVDPVRHIASEGSVSVVNLKEGKTTKELLTGLHASGLAKSSAHRFIVCCNAGSDHLSVIDTQTDTVVATIWAKPNAADLLGAAPNAAAFDASGHRLHVANGSQNAIAVFEFEAEAPASSRLLGMIPVGWYPGAIAIDESRNAVIVANIKGLPRQPKKGKKSGSDGFNSHQYFGTVSIAPIPRAEELPLLC